MKQALLFLLISVGYIITVPEVSAQSAYAGTYDVVLGYTTGAAVGKFGSTLRPGFGLASVSSKGNVRATLYWPSDGQDTLLTGKVGSNGVFRFSSLKARVRLLEDKLGMADFTDPQDNRGFIVVRQKAN